MRRAWREDTLQGVTDTSAAPSRCGTLAGNAARRGVFKQYKYVMIGNLR